jgi:hypothetical protein
MKIIAQGDEISVKREGEVNWEIGRLGGLSFHRIAQGQTIATLDFRSLEDFGSLGYGERLVALRWTTQKGCHPERSEG